MALLGSSLLPPSHRHLGSFAPEHSAAMGIHQHLAPHNLSHRVPIDILDDDDDDAVVQLFEQPSLPGDVAWQPPQLALLRFQPLIVSADPSSSPALVEAVTWPPPEPPIPPPALRAPPATL